MIKINIYSLLNSLFLAAGFYFILCKILKLPTYAEVHAAYQLTQSPKTKWTDTVLFLLSSKLAKLIRLSDYTKSRMEMNLKISGITLSPELYIAKIVVSLLLRLALVIPAGFITLIFFPLIIFWAGSECFNSINKPTKAAKIRREEIEDELPRLTDTIAQQLYATRDVIGILKGYEKSAGKALRTELGMTIADMESSSPEAGLTRLDARVGSAMLSDVVRGLLGVLDGGDGASHFNMLTHDFTQLQRQKLLNEAKKRPQKIRKYSYMFLICFVLMILIPIFVKLLEQVNALNGL